jgi:hypothetical protein
VVFGVPAFHVAAEHVGGEEVGHVHRVFRRAVGRRVGQFKLLQVEHGHPGANRRRQHVEAFVDAVVAHDLRAEDRAVVRREEQLHMH